MDDLGRGCEEHASASPADGRAEVDIFGVQEVPLVEKSSLFRIRAVHDRLPRPPQVGRVMGLAARPTTQ